jgi:hypothetical protein
MVEKNQAMMEWWSESVHARASNAESFLHLRTWMLGLKANRDSRPWMTSLHIVELLSCLMLDVRPVERGTGRNAEYVMVEVADNSND